VLAQHMVVRLAGQRPVGRGWAGRGREAAAVRLTQLEALVCVRCLTAALPMAR
jgi:hypothetical protein